ncbi:MAG: NtaA/DmoA family FMN-dependent monooxygenase [Pseudoclavibacter sp.]
MSNNGRLHFVQDWGFLRGLHDTWAEPDSGIESISDIRTYIDYVQRAEAAGIDAFFVTDFLGLNRDWLAHRPRPPFEPITLLSALATHTTSIGLVGTVSTTFTEPYNVARQLRSLDHLSGGRAGWNAVTSFNGERNFGFDTIPDPATRYRRAEEFVGVLDALWESWEPGAVLRDAVRGEYADVELVHDLDHRGEFFGVRDAIDLEPSPQRRPVQFQAGASDEGIRFAAKHAEAIFVTAPTIPDAQEFTGRLLSALDSAGRRRSDVKVLPGLRVFLGDTHEQAASAFAVPLTDGQLESARITLDREFPGLGFPGSDLDAPLPVALIPSDSDIRASSRRVSTALRYAALARSPWPSLRDFLTHYFHSKGHAISVGTPDEVAEDLQRWHASGAVDGFTLSGGNDIHGFYEEILPRLERAGVWARPTTEATLRENLEIGAW